MPHKNITVSEKNVSPVRAVVSPEWKSEKVLTSDLWMYVDLWLRRNSKDKKANFYWQQSKAFYVASRGLPAQAAPLTLYYCFLNASKALLVSKGKSFNSWHGISGKSNNIKAALSNEIITFKNKGVHPELMKYYGDKRMDPVSLKDLFQNMAFIHRAYCLSYTDSFVFFSAINPVYLKSSANDESWLSFDIEEKFTKKNILKTLPSHYRMDLGFTDRKVVRKLKKRFRWRSGRGVEKTNLNSLTKYHSNIRRDLTYIAGANKWYLKRRHSTMKVINMHVPVLIFAAMHRLSELARYDPYRLSKMLDTERNWVLAEFINTAPTQFLDEIACEITGQEIFAPDIHNGNSLSVASV